MRRLSFLFILAVLSSLLHAADCHVSNRGRDNAGGLTPTTAWSSLSRVTQATFQPGDRLLFESGGKWSGQLHPLGTTALPPS